jgi:uncharacterized protein CbrC (UPF0167 family)
MNGEKQKRLDLFVSNTQELKKSFKWSDILAKRLAALLYVMENKAVDCEAIRESHNLIKSNTGVFSAFRGNMSFCLAAMLSLKADRQEIFSNTLTVYDQMKKAKFRASDYLAAAAYEIASNAKPDMFANVIGRAKKFYDGMKARRWFCTGEDDYVFSAMLGLSEMDPAAGAERIDNLYQQLKSSFWAKNSVQTLAQILVLGGDPNHAAGRVFALSDAFKKKKIRLDKTYTIPSLGILALLPVDIDTIVSDIWDAQTFLRTQKGFSSFSVTKQELLLLSSAITATGYSGDPNNDLITASLSTSIAAIIIAQQIAIIMVASASAAVAASASSGS